MVSHPKVIYERIHDQIRISVTRHVKTLTNAEIIRLTPADLRASVAFRAGTMWGSDELTAAEGVAVIDSLQGDELPRELTDK
jgi:hypothetical protein